jgi:sarcosine oxidase, subunit alpha
MSQIFRLPAGGVIDRSRPLVFTFDGRRYSGYAGDTLASALLANGVRLVARSFKYHRPRGIVGSGSEEPNALVRLGEESRAEPNLRATEIALFDGLVARSQNRFPSLRFDVGAVNDKLSRFFPAGFYYKTFMWPASRWMSYERAIRRVAGLGRVPDGRDPDRYDEHHADADVLVAGGGPAGIAAALAAARSGARVLLADEGPVLGGDLLGAPATIDGAPSSLWLATAIAELERMEQVTLLRDATVFGHYEHSFFAIAERRPGAPFGQPRQRLWKVRAGRAIFATGAIERPLVFPDNDRPGIMLASSVRRYLDRFAVLCGRRAVVATNNDSAYAVALDLQRAGASVAAVVELREAAPSEAAAQLAARGIPLRLGHAISAVEGRGAVTAVRIVPVAAARSGASGGERLVVDLVCMSGGMTPTVHLHSQGRGKLRFAPAIGAFVPAFPLERAQSIGACTGSVALNECVRQGIAAGVAEPGVGEAPLDRMDLSEMAAATSIVPAPRGAKCFVDFQNDVTTADIALAAREGYRSVEHVKRYTTLGMGTDQGKLGNIAGLTALGDALGANIGAVGVTTFRPPYTPVTIGTLVGRRLDELWHPVRRTALHDWHEARSATMMNAGLWKRPQYYADRGEAAQAAVDREVTGVRGGVGLVDVSTLGKIEICGRDAAALLDRLYVNGWRNLAVGRGRYGVMLRDDGMVFDDGVTMRLAAEHFLMTTTTLNADAVYEWIEFLLQTAWRDLKVFVTPVTEQWFAAALAGPQSRAVLAALDGDFTVGNAEFPLMAIREGVLAGIPARVMRISFSGELSYEINVPADFGPALWQAILAAGAPFGIGVYGVEAMGTMRIEKGHVVIGAEADGRTTAEDLGLGGMLSRSKDFVGKRSLRLPGVAGGPRRQLVGLLTRDPGARFPVGAQIVAAAATGPQRRLGHVTSYAHSATLGRQVALALIEDGRARHGENLFATSPTSGVTIPVTVAEPCFIDPEGARQRG